MRRHQSNHNNKLKTEGRKALGDSTGSDDEVEVPDLSVADDEDADWDDDDADWSDDIDKHGLFLGRPTARGTGLAGNGPDVHALGNL